MNLTTASFSRLNSILIILICSCGSYAQTRKLAWSDEFNGPVIDRSAWSFDKGPTNDCVHYFTDRPENATLRVVHCESLPLKNPMRVIIILRLSSKRKIPLIGDMEESRPG